MNIGGVRLALSCRQGIDVSSHYEAYDEFYVGQTSGALETPDISVDISFGRVHDITELRDCFETGQSWSLFRDGDNYLVKFKRVGSTDCYMTALISRDISAVDLRCGNELIGSGGRVDSPVCYPLDQILLMQYLVRHEGIIAHSAGASFNGKGYLFPGCSGAGKSTISRSMYGSDKMLLLSDDRIIIRKGPDTFSIFGTPWPGDASIAVNRSAPLKGVFFLVKGGENRIEPIDESEAFRRFMPVLSVPWYDRDSVSAALSLVNGLISAVPSYLISFKPGKEVSDYLEEFISG
ncbi:MAG: hypothetical protein HZB33_05190 [Nitrospirae bacterium]|nr:hypothetical protein [Nitrospirota bacterium]